MRCVLQIDNVGNPSWQAQITGTKVWTLEPPPECYHICANQVKVTVNPGDISKYKTTNMKAFQSKANCLPANRSGGVPK